MNQVPENLAIERIDEQHVRVNINTGGKVVSLIIRVMTERAAEIVERENNTEPQSTAEMEAVA
jgi:hypothetical protein